jgi:hypothetical protein
MCARPDRSKARARRVAPGRPGPTRRAGPEAATVPAALRWPRHPRAIGAADQTAACGHEPIIRAALRGSPVASWGYLGDGCLWKMEMRHANRHHPRNSCLHSRTHRHRDCRPTPRMPATWPDLQAHGVPTGPPFTPIPAGYTIGSQLRNGATPDSLTNQFGWLHSYGPVIVDAAQHNLCPDTLH